MGKLPKQEAIELLNSLSRVELIRLLRESGFEVCENGNRKVIFEGE